MSTEENKAIMRRFFEQALNQGDASLVDQIFSSDFINHDPTPGISADRDGVKQYLAQLTTVFPDLHATIDQMIAAGDMVVIHASARGTHRGSLWGIPATGKRIEVRSVTIHRMVGGKIVERWYLLDKLSLMQQLGILPPTRQDEK